MQTLVESRISTVPMATSPMATPPWPRPFSHMRGAWGLGTSLVLGSSLALFSCIRRGGGGGGGASESSFLIPKQPAVATKLEMFKLEIFKLEMFKSEILKLEMFGLEMVG